MQLPVVRVKIHAIVISLIFMAMPAFAAQKPVQFERSSVEILSKGKTHRFTVELATTGEQMRHGLMFRKSLAADHGMLFVFTQPASLSMWMKNTYLPLDMLFIDEAGKITFIAENTTPLSERLIEAPALSKAVLELPAHSARTRGITQGDTLRHATYFP